MNEEEISKDSILIVQGKEHRISEDLKPDL